MGCRSRNEGASVAPDTGLWGEVVRPGLSANTVCASVRAAVPVASGGLGVAGATVTPPVPLTGASESGDVKDTVAVLSFILSSAAKHSVDGESLASELQQLGPPKEHAASLCRSYEEKQSPLQKHLWICSLCSKYEASQGPGSF
uniref:Uncharacterized protein n=1 Tax=Theropithecus gelada TaxID=9565 RepID=A0A8D2GJC8_THEGE